MAAEEAGIASDGKKPMDDKKFLAIDEFLVGKRRQTDEILGRFLVRNYPARSY